MLSYILLRSLQWIKPLSFPSYTLVIQIIALMIWNISGLKSSHKQTEIKGIINKRKILVFELLKYKIKFRIQQAIRDAFTEEWESFPNCDSLHSDQLDSIWFFWNASNVCQTTPLHTSVHLVFFNETLRGKIHKDNQAIGV